MKYRVTVLETQKSTEYLLDTIIESKQKPRTIVNKFLKLYPNVHCIEARQVNPFLTRSYSISTGLR